jgi:hypothetical protein
MLKHGSGFPSTLYSKEESALERLLEAGVVLPRRQLRGFEAIGKLLIGHERLFRFVRSRTDERQPKIVGEEADRIEQYPLFAIGAGEKGMDFIDHEQTDFELSRQCADTVAQRGHAHAVSEDAAHCRQEFFVQVPLAGRRRHLDRDHGKPRPSQLFVEVRAIISQELLDDAGLTHASCAVDDEAWHTIPWRVVNEVHQALQDALGARILNPAFLAKPVNALGVRQQRRFAARGFEMAQLADCHSDSHISTGKGSISVDRDSFVRDLTEAGDSSAGVGSFSCRRRLLGKRKRLLNEPPLIHNVREDGFFGIQSLAVLPCLLVGRPPSPKGQSAVAADRRRELASAVCT